MSKLGKEQKINSVVAEEMKGFKQERNPKEREKKCSADIERRLEEWDMGTST
jgi:hypothetical protein